MICVLINGDSRAGSDADVSTVGDFGSGSLQGVRSFDLLTETVVMANNFFEGYSHEIILSIDEHEPLPLHVRVKLDEFIRRGELKSYSCFPRNRTRHRWNDWIYLDTFRLAPPEVDYIVHLDQDAVIFRDPNSDIVARYFKWLDEGYSYVCQPHNGGDPMWWASTRFFICKAATLDLDELERCLDDGYKARKFEGKHLPCVEHVLGAMAGEGKVLYPEPEMEDYLIVNWASYRKGLLHQLNNLPYHDVMEYIEDCGIFGASDVIAK